MYSVTLIGFLKKLFMVAEAAKLFFQMKTYVRLSKKMRTIPLITMRAFRTMCQKRQIQQQKVDLREPKEMYSDIQLHFKV